MVCARAMPGGGGMICRMNAANLSPMRLGVWSPAHERASTLKTACLVRIKPGYRRPMSEEERAWLKSLSPFANIAGFGTAKMRDCAELRIGKFPPISLNCRRICAVWKTEGLYNALKFNIFLMWPWLR
jgi:hypothetical protein